MKSRSIIFKLLATTSMTFISAAIIIIYLLNHNLKSIIEKEQYSKYNEKISLIISEIDHQYLRLKQTGMIEHYADDFKKSLIKKLEKRYYRIDNQNIYPIIIDGNGNIIMHPSNISHNQLLDNAEHIKKITQMKNGEIIFDEIDNNHWHIFNYYKEWDWIINFIVPISAKYKDLKKIRFIIITIMSISTLIALFIIFYFILKITKPISLLTKAVQAISLGDLNQTIDIKQKTNDEIGVLAKNFIKMRETIIDKISQLENEVESRKKAEQIAHDANHAKTEFLSNISHELRTPMHGILSYAKYGIEDLKNENIPQDEILNDFIEIRDSGIRLLSLLDDLLDLAKLESGKVSYNMEDNDLTIAVDTILSELSSLTKEKSLLFNFLAPDTTTVTIFDSLKIQQVIRNLISNAIKFSFANNQINIQINQIIKNEAKYLQVSVTNMGIGIPENELNSIFDKFVQSSINKRRSGGTGLGLAISQKIIKDHGGDIWAESKPSSLTTFRFTLPLLPTKTGNQSG